MLLTQFDPTKNAVINPSDINTPIKDMPEIAVACYSYTTFEKMLTSLHTKIIATSSCANGVTNIYSTTYKATNIALFTLDVGAPMSVGMLEDVFEMGVKKVIIFGTCGVLDKGIEDCSIIIPNSAVRDEGTSYHYAPASDEIKVNEKYINVLTKMLDELHVKYTVGKVWSTDAIYRETPEKVKRRKEQGCICVDMECSANAAAAGFREKDLIQFFYAADNLDAEDWDMRSLSNHSKLDEKDRIARIALELAVRIGKQTEDK